MKSITNLKNGNFYYIETLEIVKECFVDALAGLFSVIGNKFTHLYLKKLKMLNSHVNLLNNLFSMILE